MSNAITTLGRRAHLPAIVFSSDLAVALQVSCATAARWLREGRLGPSIRIGRRSAILRDTLLARLRAMEEGASDTTAPNLASDRPDQSARPTARTPRGARAR